MLVIGYTIISAKANIYFETEEFSMTKKTLAILVASLLILSAANMTGVSAKSSEDLPIGYYNTAEPYRYLTFATDGGSFIKALEKPIGEKISLDTYIPAKQGYILMGGTLTHAQNK